MFAEILLSEANPAEDGHLVNYLAAFGSANQGVYLVGRPRFDD